jgi:glycosyl transferase family 4
LGLTVLITNARISARTGTELQAFSLALYLLESGHRPIIYSPVLGPLAAKIRERSILVVGDIGNIDERIDVIHGHHNPTTAIAVARFPETPAVFVCHDFTAWHDAPPLLPSILRYVAVDEAVRDRLVLEAGIPADKVELEPNAVDLARFEPAAALPAKPRRALVVAKNHNYVNAIRKACKARGIVLDVAGHGANMPIAAPEEAMRGYDVVFASALSAMEAMAMGRAVICCDGRGLAGLVTTATYPKWRPINFGLRSLTSAVTPEAILENLDRYAPLDAAKVSAMLRAEGGWRESARCWLERYRRVIDEWQRRPADSNATQVALARHLQTWMPDMRRRDEWPWMAERQMLMAELERLAKGIEPLPLGVKRDFGEREKANWYAPDRGFWARDPTAAWTSAQSATFRVWLDSPPQADLAATITVSALFPPNGGDPLRFEILLGGAMLLQSEINPKDPTRNERTFAIPRGMVAESGNLWFEARSSRLLSPQAGGLSHDTRKMGIGLVDLTIRAAPG